MRDDAAPARLSLQQRELGPTSRTVLLCVLGLLSGSALLVTAVVGVRGPSRTSAALSSRALPAELALEDVARAAAQGQADFLAALGTQDSATRATAIDAAQVQGQLKDTSWSAYRKLAFNGADEQAPQQSYEASTSRDEQLAASLLSAKTTDSSWPGLAAEEELEADAQLAALATLESRVYRPVVTAEAAATHSGLSALHSKMMLSSGIVALLFGFVGLVLTSRARRDQRLLASEAAALRFAGEQAEFEGALQRGLEMATSEDAAFDVIKRALTMVDGAVPVEFLLADSNRAHVRQVLSTQPAPEAGCRVGSPADCPCATTGQTRVFETSTDLDTCRFLRDHDSPVWAVCTPVNVAGRATGVLHAQAPVERELPAGLASGLELVARKAGERVGALRTLARTEAEAHADPLTGLPNRRTLENQVRELSLRDTPYVVAFADLDYFKLINDVHGHDTGDRALRLFARVVRDSVRPRDLVSRHGGEEFVAVFPDCSLADARSVAERIRSQLAEAVAQATIPPFTVTIGLATAEADDALADIIASADAAMLRAKALGRDRVLAAGDVVGDVTGDVTERAERSPLVVSTNGDVLSLGR